jgi:putative iron-regulated protein
MMKKLLLSVALVASLVSFQACKDDDDKSLTNDDLKVLAIKNYADIVYASYDDSYKTALALKTAVDDFVAAPSEQGLKDCKAAWKASRIPYGQTEAFRFYGGPIDDEDGPEGLINAWPIDESYIDYVSGNASSGIINDGEITISKAELESLNEAGSETSISTGYHAIEFLLWGQDLSSDTTGIRPYTDFISGEGSTAENAQRRGQYLKVVTELLTDHLKAVRDEWAEGASYRQAFINGDVSETLGMIFNGMGELSKGELAGERMLVAVESGDQENEHSCFSDNTHVDILMNFKSVKNIYLGEYERVDGSVVAGTSFADIAARMASTKNDLVITSLATTEDDIEEIDNPFDQAIANDEDDILAAADQLSILSDRIADVALSIGATNP